MIFKNINSEDISGLIICSEPPISSSAIRTKETTIDGRDGAIVEKLGYKTRIRNVEIGLKKDANVDKILSYFSGEGDLIFKNENDKVYKAAIYEQVDLERLLRLRKGSVAFYCQPFKYKRNDIFETIKDNKVKEKKGKHLELLNCAEQNVVDLKLEGSTTQATRSGKNLFDASKIANTSIEVLDNGKTIKMPIVTSGNGYINTNKKLSELCPKLKVGDEVYLFLETTSNINKFIYLTLSSYTWTRNTLRTITQADLDSNVYLYGNRYQDGETEQVILTDLSIMLSSETNTEWEAYGASPSPDYPSEIENVEGKNKFNKSNMTEATWDTGKTNTVTLLEDGRIQSTANYAQWAAKCIDIPNLKANTNYVVSGKIVSSTAGNAMITVKGYKNNTLSNIIYRQYAVGTKFELSFNSSDYEKIGISLSGNNGTLGTIYTTIFDEIQLEEGTVATPYVPYNSLAVKVTGKNIFDKSIYTNSIYNGYFLKNILKVGQNYTISFKNIENKTYDFLIKPKLGVAMISDMFEKYSKTAVTFNYTQAMYDKGYTLFITSISDYQPLSIDEINNMDIQLEEGTETTDYEPYKSQVVTFPLSEGQKLYKDSYLASDGIHHKRKQYTFTGNETVNITTYGNNKRFTVVPSSYNPSYKGQDTVGLCNYLKRDYMGTVGNANLTQEPCFFIHSSGILITMTPDINIVNETQLKTWLSQNHVTVEYELATEEIVPYTTAQQEAYNQLQKLKLYKGQNTMFSLEGSIINLKYLEDTDEKVENQGNIYSKPIIRLEKTVFKEVEIAINGIRFKYNFEEDDYVEIDCEEMTVQYEGLDRNRRLVIDFEFPKLKEGNNDIVMYNGDCIIKCKRKDRWL